MDTQNTPVHINLWHREFWMLSLSNLFLCMAVYMLIPVVPGWLIKVQHITHWHVALAFVSFGIGLFSLGGVCRYLVEEYRRNRVCMLCIGIVMVCIYALSFVEKYESGWLFWIIIGLCFLLGAMFGLSQMILSSTLIIDVCESFRRTEANYAASWFSRFALTFGPIFGLFTSNLFGMKGFVIGSALCCLVSMVLIYMVKFPFKAPEEGLSIFSLDRFFLPQGKYLFVNLILVSMVLGIFQSLVHSITFYGMMAVGFFVALLAQKFAFANANLKSETITGLLTIAMAILMFLTRKDSSVHLLIPAFIGFGVSLIASRFQLFFIKLSKHCQRGTSQSSYFLASELGLSIGLSLGWSYLFNKEFMALWVMFALVLMAFLYYNCFVHHWYMENKNR